MKRLKTVTISGADDAIKIDDLIALSAKYPFVEWGILASPKNHGKLRYPTIGWLHDFGTTKVKKSIHLCGDYARVFALCSMPDRDVKDITVIVNDFDRAQINLGNQLDAIDIKYFAWNMFESKISSYILQMPNDGPEAIKVFDALNVELGILNSTINIYPFIDASGGKGIADADWRAGISLSRNNYRGRAGGINKDNVVSVITEINSALIGEHQQFWIDMESGVRTDNKFDLNLVENVLSQCEPFVVVE